jgi:ribosome biogenesis GTPase
MTLHAYGWTEFFEQQLTAAHAGNSAPGRVVTENREMYRLFTADGFVEATLTGRLRHHARASDQLPVVGDWVAVQEAAGRARITGVLPRRTQLSRIMAGGRARQQPVAANLDAALLIMGLDGDYNPRRLERLVVLAWESGARPVVLLNKRDLCAEADALRQEIAALVPGVPVLTASFTDDCDLHAIQEHLAPRETAVLLGSSGAGKSTLLNRLAGQELLATGSVREGDQRGRHTTTQRHLVRLPGGALLMDNPGIREVGLWSAEEGLDATFADIAEMAPGCRFRDCSHAAEPGCAVLSAVETGALSRSRLESYRTLQRELRHIQQRQDEQARRREQRRIVAIHRAVKKHKPRR